MSSQAKPEPPGADSKIAVIKELAAFVTAAAALVPVLKNASLPAWFTSSWWWTVSAALVIALMGALVVWHVRRRRPVRSRLVVPEGLRLSAGNKAHLVGRQDDTRRLIDCCRANPLVFLDGPSGVGKSALITAGLRPALASDHQFVPVLVNNWGRRDWVVGAFSATREALLRDLPETCGDLVQGLSRTAPGGLAALLQTASTRLQKTPLLILDQFDDYQIAFRDSFLPLSTGTWLTPQELKTQNAYWRELAVALEAETVHLLVVTRSDMSGGLTSVRFVEPRHMSLLGLPRSDISSLICDLGEATFNGKSVVSNPEQGWTRLAPCIARDLAKDEMLVLPQRLSTLLLALQELDALDEASYAAAGRSEGLSTRFIDAELQAASDASGLEVAALRSVLRLLVDNESKDKTAPRNETEVLTHLATLSRLATTQQAQALARAAERLEERQVLRRRVDPDSGQALWQLDHDYLTHGVLGSVKRANRWQHALDGAWDGFNSRTPGWLGAWRALMPPRAWVQTLWARLRGRVQVGPAQPLLVWSTLRLLPGLAVVLCVWALVWAQDQADKADQLWKRFEFAGDLSSNEVAALDELRDASALARWSFTRQLFNTPSLAGRFLTEPLPLIHALVNLDRDRATALQGRARLAIRQVPPPQQEQQPRLMLAALVASAVLSDTDPEPDDARNFLCRALELDQDKLRPSLSVANKAILSRGIQRRLAQADAGQVCASQTSFSTLLKAAAVSPSSHFHQAWAGAAGRLGMGDLLAQLIPAPADVDKPDYYAAPNGGPAAQSLEAFLGQAKGLDEAVAIDAAQSMLELVTRGQPHFITPLALLVPALPASVAAGLLDRLVEHVVMPPPQGQQRRTELQSTQTMLHLVETLLKRAEPTLTERNLARLTAALVEPRRVFGVPLLAQLALRFERQGLPAGAPLRRSVLALETAALQAEDPGVGPFLALMLTNLPTTATTATTTTTTAAAAAGAGAGATDLRLIERLLALEPKGSSRERRQTWAVIAALALRTPPAPPVTARLLDAWAEHTDWLVENDSIQRPGSTGFESTLRDNTAGLRIQDDAMGAGRNPPPALLRFIERQGGGDFAKRLLTAMARENISDDRGLLALGRAHLLAQLSAQPGLDEQLLPAALTRLVDTVAAAAARSNPALQVEPEPGPACAALVGRLSSTGAAALLARLKLPDRALAAANTRSKYHLVQCYAALLKQSKTVDTRAEELLFKHLGLFESDPVALDEWSGLMLGRPAVDSDLRLAIRALVDVVPAEVLQRQWPQLLAAMDGKQAARVDASLAIARRLPGSERARLLADLTAAAATTRSAKSLEDLGRLVAGMEQMAPSNDPQNSAARRFLMTRAVSAHQWDSLLGPVIPSAGRAGTARGAFKGLLPDPERAGPAMLDYCLPLPGAAASVATSAPTSVPTSAPAR